MKFKEFRVFSIALMTILLFLLSSCISLTETSTEVPTFTGTPINLGNISLDEIVYVDGDLPSTYDIGQTIILIPNDLKTSVPNPENFIMKKFPDSNFKNDISTINILLYSSPGDIEKAYEYFDQQVTSVKDSSIVSIDPIGDKSKLTYAYGVGMDSNLNFVNYQKAQLVFQKCNAIVYIQLYSGTASKEEITNYAARVEKRIIKAICP